MSIVRKTTVALGIAALAATVTPIAISQAQPSRYDALANAPMKENRPTPDAAAMLKEELLFQRATQTYLWAMPLINTLGMKVGSEKTFGAGYNILPVWKKRLDAKTLVTTPNSDVIYAMSYLDLGKDGPMVFEAPPGLQGILLDFWQRPIPGPTIDGHEFFGDVGLPGPDAGKGGNFLILPPGYEGEVPEGYFVYRSGTNNVFVFLRSFYQDPADLKPAVDPDGGRQDLSAWWRDEREADGVSGRFQRAGEHAAGERCQRIRSAEAAGRQRRPAPCRP
jgi:hypothetical protein